MRKDKPKILIYDLESTPLAAYVWRCGDQVVRHNQLIKGLDQYNIICIAYAWLDGGPVKVLTWDPKTHCSKKMVEEFDAIVKTADMTIGKNSDRFDVKMINTQRLIHDLPPMPEWMDTRDDLEKQMRKYFYLPSQSLDYISAQMGLGGKTKMEFQDWIDIVERNENEEKSFKKMCKYGKKDVADTRAIIRKVWPHVKPKFNHSAYNQEPCCVTCGSKDIYKNGTILRGSVIYQRFACKKHGGHAGYRAKSAKDSTILR